MAKCVICGRDGQSYHGTIVCFRHRKKVEKYKGGD